MQVQLLNTVDRGDYKIVFTDLFDTLVHRTKHPNHCLKLWAKYLIIELGLQISTAHLFNIRKESLTYLAKKMRCNALEIDYEELKLEVFKRLSNYNLLNGEIEFEKFSIFFERADYQSEIGLQKLNQSMCSQIITLSEKGVRLFLITDINLSKGLILKILNFHDLLNVFENVYVSSDSHKSKYKGELYQHVVVENDLNVDEIVMVGDNKRSDILNVERHGIKGLYVSNSFPKFKNKTQLFGSEETDFKKACNTVVKECRKSDYVFSEYLIHYHFFVSRIYAHAKKYKITDLFFLAREGLFLKHIFEDYQKLNGLSEDFKIRAHYLKISRQASIQISLKPLDQEDFKFLKKRADNLSINQFLDNFNAGSSVREKITAEMDYDLDAAVERFFQSNVFLRLKENTTFIAFYNKNRTDQKIAFDTYLNSFGANIEHNGMTLVDIGWGGTMQESLYKYFKRKIPVTGLYLGVKEIYNIENETKRFGLNFSIYPSTGFDDDILLANGQLYEQLAAAPHGCTIAYANDPENPTVEFHEEEEKNVYENYVGDIQTFMRAKISELSAELKYIDYTELMAQEYMVRLALRTGLFMSRSKLRFIHQISKGFFQNIGDNKVGLTYETKALPFSKKMLVTKLMLRPEKLFRYFVKLKPRLYEKGLYPLVFIVNPIYYYLILHRYFKKKLFPKNLI